MKEAGEDDELEDDDGADKCKKSLKPCTTSEKRAYGRQGLVCWVSRAAESAVHVVSLRQTLRCARQLKPDMFLEHRQRRHVAGARDGASNDGRRGLHRRLLNERQVIVGRHWEHREAGNDVQNASNRSGADGAIKIFEEAEGGDT